MHTKADHITAFGCDWHACYTSATCWGTQEGEISVSTQGGGGGGPFSLGRQAAYARCTRAAVTPHPFQFIPLARLLYIPACMHVCMPKRLAQWYTWRTQHTKVQSYGRDMCQSRHSHQSSSPSYITTDLSSPGSSTSLTVFNKVLSVRLIRPQVGPH